MGRTGDQNSNPIKVTISSSKFSILADAEEVFKERKNDGNGNDTEMETSDEEEGEFDENHKEFDYPERKRKGEIRSTINPTSFEINKQAVRK